MINAVNYVYGWFVHVILGLPYTVNKHCAKCLHI